MGCSLCFLHVTAWPEPQEFGTFLLGFPFTQGLPVLRFNCFHVFLLLDPSHLCPLRCLAFRLSQNISDVFCSPPAVFFWTGPQNKNHCLHCCSSLLTCELQLLFQLVHLPFAVSLITLYATPNFTLCSRSALSKPVPLERGKVRQTAWHDSRQTHLHGPLRFSHRTATCWGHAGHSESSIRTANP